MAGKAVVWVTEGTWPACVDAARAWVPEGMDVVLLHVSGTEVGAAQGALAGLFGRGRRGADPGGQMAALSAEAADDLLAQAAGQLGRAASTEQRTGRVEREVVNAADGADLLICARDGEQSRLGPHSLGRHARFVVDHAPCPVLLVWPVDTPGIDSIPPPPPPGQEPPPPPHER